MNWWQRLFHTCETPSPDTFAPIAGRRWVCPNCEDEWVYETRIFNIEVSPAVWDRWAETERETITAWYKTKD